MFSAKQVKLNSHSIVHSQEEVRRSTMVRRAFDKAVRRKPPVVAVVENGKGPDSHLGQCPGNVMSSLIPSHPNRKSIFGERQEPGLRDCEEYELEKEKAQWF
jgi:hypothetical protein